MARRKIPDVYKKAIAEVQELLDLDTPVYWRQTRKGVGGTAYAYSYKVIISNYYLDCRSKVDYEWAIHLIAHELRHIWQYKTGIYDGEYTWNNTSYEKKLKITKGTIPEGYRNQPWEKDANDFADTFMQDFLKRYPYKAGILKSGKRYMFSNDTIEPVYFSNGNINYRQTVLRAYTEGKRVLFKDGYDSGKYKRAKAQLKVQGLI